MTMVADPKPEEQRDRNTGEMTRPDRSFQYYRNHIEHAKLQRAPISRMSEREHAVQTALAFSSMLVIAGASIVMNWLLP
jgi:hypothetical protein